jgi:predicted MFS family arabinose efflux permease
VPLTWVAGALSIAQLIIVAALISALTICFDVAYRSYLPALIGRDELVEGNSKLAATDSVAEVAGFGLAGILVQVLGAPLAVLLDAFSFVGSAVSLALIRKPEPDAGRAATAGDAAPASAWREIAEGLALIRHEPTLRALVAAIAIDLFFIHIFVATLTLFLTRELALGPAIQGASFAIGGISAFAGALLAERVARRWGLGRALVGSFLIYRLATYFIPLAAGPPAAVVGLISFAQLLDAGATVQQISQTSLIQTITPDRLLGRFYASLQTIEKLAILLGLLLGGVLGQRIGLRPTLLIGITGSLLAIPFFLLAPAVRAGDVAAPAAEAGVVAD